MARSQALNTFRARARKMPPTREHRAAIWECMLGTVYAMNKEGEVRYCDYRYEEAVAFVGEVEDVRVARFRDFSMRTGAKRSEDYQRPREGQLVWFVKDVRHDEN